MKKDPVQRLLLLNQHNRAFFHIAFAVVPLTARGQD
jgi:hypothetical protein